MDLDINAAVSDIGAGLGFETSNTEGDSGANDAGLDSGTGGDAGALDAHSAADTDAPVGSGDAGGAAKPAVGGEPAAPATEGSPAPAAGVDFPKTWNARLTEKWAAVDPDVKAEIAKREEDFFKGIEGYKADAAFGKNFKAIMQPWEALFRQHNVDPVVLTHNLMMAHRTLALGRPEEKQALFKQLAKDYQIDVSKAFAPEPDLPPEVRELRQRQEALESENRRMRDEQVQATRQSLAAMLDKFASDPKNAYFDQVADDIAVLVKGGLTLEEAYEKAVWANPVTRAKEQARLQTEQAEKARKEAAEKAAKARAATAANARASNRDGRGTAPLGSMDDTINETLAKIKKRT